MKKLVCLILILMFGVMAFAGGLVTNINQSAAYVRTLNRNASTGIDAVFFNPAGLTSLENGLHVYLSNQTIMQEKTIETDNPFLSRDEYVGEVNVPLYPNVYVAYKMDKLTLSAGFMPIGGGGSAEYNDGLPAIEMLVKSMVPIPEGAQLSGFDASFEGSSIYYGGQAGASYKLNDMLSIAVGGRYVMVSNHYEGNVDLAISVPTQGTSTQQIGVDVDQTGSGITPIVSLFAEPNDALDLSLRYEMKTEIEIENDTKKDDTQILFPDEEKSGSDLPALLALGASCQINPELKLEASFNYFFAEDVDWDGVEENLENEYEGGLALEYALTEALMASAGYLYSTTSAMKGYQNDFSYGLDSHTLGLGVGYKVNEKLRLDAGVLNTFYTDMEVSTNQVFGTPLPATVNRTYKKTTFDFSIGLGYSF